MKHHNTFPFCHFQSRLCGMRNLASHCYIQPRLCGVRDLAFVLLFLICSISLTAQNLQVHPSVQPVNGGTVRVGNFVVDWTLGQPAQTVLRNGNLMITQGFQQQESMIFPVQCDGAYELDMTTSRLAGCEHTSSDYEDFYSLQSNWIPNDNTPIKYLNVRFQICQRSDPNDKGNFDCDNPDQISFFENIIQSINYELAHVPIPSDPYSDICGVCHIADSRIRLVISGINCFISDAGIFPDNRPDEITFRLTVSVPGNGPGGTTGGPGMLDLPTNSYVGFYPYQGYSISGVLGNYFSAYQNLGFDAIKRNLAHELGHAMGLYHVYEHTRVHEPCDISNPEYLSDVFGSTYTASCWEPYDINSGNPCNAFASVGDHCSNNYMGWKGFYLSPLQLGRIHRNLALTDLRSTACGYGPIPFEVSTNQTWDFDIKFYQDIVVKSGATLIITCKVNMVPGAKIIVEPGGKLIVDGGTITNSTSRGCDGLWGGITVQGNKNLSQDLSTGNNETAISNNQGFVYLNDATIENAEEALRVWNLNDGWVSQNTVDNQGGTGGIVRAVNTIFKNNRRSAEFMWYKSELSGIEVANKSYFYLCHFIVDDNTLDNYTHTGHVTAWGVQNIVFKGCIFENARTITEDTRDIQLGSGIITIDAGITVTDFDPSLSAYGNNLVRSQFINLQHGVYVAHQNSLYASTVYHAQFTNCLRGIRNEGVSPCQFIGNEFTMGGNKADVGSPDIDEGIILSGNMAGYTVEQNSFKRIANDNDQSFGARADNTGPNENRIYNNSFEALTVGNLANRQNQNGSRLNPHGLVYECNSHSADEWIDIVSNDNQGNALAGIKQVQGSLSASAGNTFSHNVSSPFSTTSDIANYNAHVDYYHFNTSDEPFYVSNNVTVTSPVGIRVNTCASNFILPTETTTTGSCPTCLSMADHITAYTGHSTAFRSANAAYSALIDGGNTTARLVLIDTSTNADSLKQNLIAFSPNLSTRVLNAVALKYSLLNDTMQHDIFKANAEGVDNKVMADWIKWAGPPQWMRDSVLLAQSTLTYRSYLLDTLIFHAGQKQTSAYNVLHSIIEDSLGIDLSLYRQWLDSADGVWAKREKVNSYLHEGKLDTAVNLLALYDTTAIDNAQDSVDFKTYKDYVLAYKDWIATDSSIMRLDSAHLATLKTMASQNEHSKGAQLARNVLNFFYDSLYFTPPLLPEIISAKKGNEEETLSPVAEKTVTPKLLSKPRLRLYPNPAQNILTIEYSGVAENSKLYIMSMIGELVETKTIGSDGKVELNTSTYQNGVYLARIEAGSNAVLKSKFVILK